MLDYFSAEGVLHTVHELAATPLNDILHDSDGHGLPRTEVAEHALGIASGLAHMHRRGMTHGDLSLANVLLSMEGVVKISDHGAVFCASSAFVDAPKTTCYVEAPEAALGARRLTHAVDVWAASVLWFCMRIALVPWFYEDDVGMRRHSQVQLLGPRRSSSWRDLAMLSCWRSWRDQHGQYNVDRAAATFQDAARAALSLPGVVIEEEGSSY